MITHRNAKPKRLNAYHSITRSILAGKTHDGRFLRLIDGLLRAGYLEEWRYHPTLSGCPQGSLCEASHKEPYEQCWVMRSARG
jgi:hypothetical protein